MATVYIEDTAATAELVPAVLPTSATVAILNPGGTEKVAATAATLDSLDTTVTALTSQTQFTVGAVTGMKPGSSVWWKPANSPAGSGALLRISEVNTSNKAIVVEATPAGTIAIGDAIKGVTLTYSVASTVFDERGLFWTLRWAITGDDSVVTTYKQQAHVVRTPFRQAVTADEVARYLGAMYPGESVVWDSGHYLEVARRASMRVERRLIASGRYPHLVGDPTAFMDAGLVALRIELAHEGLMPGASDPGTYVEDQGKELDRLVGEALASLHYDADDDGAADLASEIRTLYSVQLSRV